MILQRHAISGAGGCYAALIFLEPCIRFNMGFSRLFTITLSIFQGTVASPGSVIKVLCFICHACGGIVLEESCLVISAFGFNVEEAILV